MWPDSALLNNLDHPDNESSLDIVWSVSPSEVQTGPISFLTGNEGLILYGSTQSVMPISLKAS